jgi:hypothetical protein
MTRAAKAPGVRDHARVALPYQKAQGAIDVAPLSGHYFPVAARVIKKNCLSPI